MSHEHEHTTRQVHSVPEQPWANQRQLFSTLGLVVVVGVIIGALYLLQTTTTTTTARELLELDQRRQRLERDNELLRGEIAELQSLPRLMTRAAELGFRPARDDEIMYLIVEGYRYNRPRVTPTPVPAPTQVEEIYDETLSGWFRQQWDALRDQFARWRES